MGLVRLRADDASAHVCDCRAAQHVFLDCRPACVLPDIAAYAVLAACHIRLTVAPSYRLTSVIVPDTAGRMWCDSGPTSPQRWWAVHTCASSHQQFLRLPRPTFHWHQWFRRPRRGARPKG